jgi:hypothetical protein
MAWEIRSRGSYYYRSVKIGGHVVKQYFGRGAIGTVAESYDAKARQRRDAERDALRDEQDRLEPADRAMTALDAACRQVLEATLLAAGFHQNRRSWRKRRARTSLGTP